MPRLVAAVVLEDDDDAADDYDHDAVTTATRKGQETERQTSIQPKRRNKDACTASEYDRIDRAMVWAPVLVDEAAAASASFLLMAADVTNN
jgi:hypothetical protein